MTRQLDIYGPASGDANPVVVLLHGGGATKDHPDVVDVGQLLSEAGFVVFVPTHAATSPDALVADDGRRLRETFEDVRCALRYAGEHASAHGGDPSRVSLVGQSAGGLIGMISFLGGNRVLDEWNDVGKAPAQTQCVATAEAPQISGFAGYNGSYLFFSASELPDTDPDLWALANPRHFAANGSGRVRMIEGENDFSTPPWHDAEIKTFAEELRSLGYDAEVVVIEQGVHGWTTKGPVWDAMLETIVETTGP